VLILIGDHGRFEKVFVIDDVGFTIEGLHYHLLTIWLKVEVCDELPVEEVDIVALKDGVVGKERGQEKEGVADDGCDRRDKDGLDEQRVYYCGVQCCREEATRLYCLEINLLVFHAHYRVYTAIARVVDKVQLSLWSHNREAASLSRGEQGSLC
jgi:hypothetical protein